MIENRNFSSVLKVTALVVWERNLGILKMEN